MLKITLQTSAANLTAYLTDTQRSIPVIPNQRFSKDYITFSYNESEYTTDRHDLHCHNFYEIYFFMEGDVDYLVEGHRYRPTPGSLLLLSPNVFHGVKIVKNQVYKRISVHFHPDILTPERRTFLLSVFPTQETLHQEQIFYEHTDRFLLPFFFESLLDCISIPDELTDRLLPIRIESLLSQIVAMTEVLSPQKKETVSGSSSETIPEMIRYINEHLTDDITLDFLSARFFISKHHLNKIFRKATGTTVMDYLLHKRIAAAQQLLIGGASAQNACLQAGFHDYSAFYRAYTRIMGHTPVKDRGVLPTFTHTGSSLLETRQDLSAQ